MYMKMCVFSLTQNSIFCSKSKSAGRKKDGKTREPLGGVRSRAIAKIKSKGDKVKKREKF